ncbi:presqualene diphosphate synthase HpnD [Ameyamaea chiangmaiensis]
MFSDRPRGQGRPAETSPLGCDLFDLSYVEMIVTGSGTSFAKGMQILSPDRRYGMFAVYAFCRVVDDIADGDAPMADKRTALDAWRVRIAALYEGMTNDALDRVLRAAIMRFGLRREDFEAVIDGMQMDAEAPVVAPDEATFDLYCDRVASAVGRLSVRVFGDASPMADRVAHHLGRALQFTNILRDIAEDARIGRLYLPRELLVRFGVPADPARVLDAPGLPGLCAVLAGRAHDHFRAAAQAMAACDRVAMRPARIMGASYAAILSGLERRGWDRPRVRVSVSKPRKIAAVARAYFG